jgi:hypothetical protein
VAGRHEWERSGVVGCDLADGVGDRVKNACQWSPSASLSCVVRSLMSNATSRCLSVKSSETAAPGETRKSP